MSLLENPEIEFKIAPPESMFIIGSKSINVAGDVYSMMDVNAIIKAANRRNKRMLDIVLSLIFLPFYLVLFAFVKKPLVFFANIFAVFFGIKTWVGYAKAPKNEQLPKIKTSILNPLDIQAQNHESNLADKLNLAYAKNYSVWNDLKIIRSGFKNLGRS
ncbi:MAG: hypothetical protein COA57_13010 [Flavobacteriales bacterium]|nr:MAG: hypothetical protein COA57_13010 [Flavobacteriales bacterium]